MGVVVDWMLSQGVKLGASYVEAEVRKSLGIEDLEAVITRKLEVVDRKLNLLIQAPALQAKMFLREGNLERCKDKLIEAISLNELDLPATVLYCLLLQKTGQEILALEYYEEIAEKFGLHVDVLPAPLIQAFSDYAEQRRPLHTIAGFTCPLPSSPAPPKVFFSLDYLVVWVSKSKGFLGWLFGGGEFVVVLDWTGRIHLKIEERGISVLAVTRRYLAICRQNQDPQIVRLKDGSEAGSLSREKVQELFGGNPGATACMLLGKGGATTFAGASIRFNNYSRRHVEQHYSTEQGFSDEFVETSALELVVEGSHPYVTERIHELQEVYLFSKNGSLVGALEEPRQRIEKLELTESLGGQSVVLVPAAAGKIPSFRIWRQYETRLSAYHAHRRLILLDLPGYRSSWREISRAKRSKEFRFEIPLFTTSERRSFPRISPEKICEAAASEAKRGWGGVNVLNEDHQNRVFIHCVRLSVLANDQEIFLLELYSLADS